MNNKWLPSLLRVSVGFALLLSAASLCAGKNKEFKTGKLVDISSDEKLHKGTSVDYAIYQVQIGDIVYFGQGEKMPKHPADAGHGLVIGDSVQAAVDGKDLILQRPDGKEIKTKIIKRQRATAKP